MNKANAANEENSANMVIEASGINRIFPVSGGEFQALKDINLKVPEHKLTILRGKSGSGKTTLMNIIGALDYPTSGQILMDGKEITALPERQRENLRRTQFGFVFQSVSLIPTMNVYQNVEYALRMAGIKGDHKHRVEECLKMVGLSARMTHMPAELSGGEQQRVAIARAIAHKPRILFADEPTAELDSGMAAEVAALFKRMTEQENITIIMTTHDVGLMGAGDMIVELQNGMQV